MSQSSAASGSGTGSFSFSYSPDPLVTDVANFPHYDLSFKSTDSEFTTDADSTYFESFAVMAMFFAALGLLQILIFCAWMFFRCCCVYFCMCTHLCYKFCCRCGNHEIELDHSKDHAHIVYSKGSVRHWRVSLFTVLMLTTVSGLSGIDGTTRLTTGFEDISASLDYVRADLVALADAGHEVSRLSLNMQLFLMSLEKKCSMDYFDDYFQEMYDALDDLGQGAEQVADGIGSMPGSIDEAKEYIAVVQENAVVFTALPIVGIMGIAGLGLVGTLCSSKAALRLLTFVGIVVLLVVVCVVTVEVPLSVLFADICLDPDRVVIDLAAEDSDTAAVATYYLQCNGESPVTEGAEIAESATNQIRDVIDELQSHDIEGYTFEDICGSLDPLSETVDGVGDLLLNIAEILDCEVIAEPWDQAIRRGLCSEVTPGLIIMWSTCVASGEMLFLSLIVAALTWKRFHVASQEELDKKLLPTKLLRKPSQYRNLIPESPKIKVRTPLVSFRSFRERVRGGFYDSESDEDTVDHSRDVELTIFAEEQEQRRSQKRRESMEQLRSGPHISFDPALATEAKDGRESKARVLSTTRKPRRDSTEALVSDVSSAK